MKSIEDTLATELATKVAKEIDISSLAKKIAPQVAKEITAQLFRAIKGADIDDLIAFMGDSKKTENAFHAALTRALNKLK